MPGETTQTDLDWNRLQGRVLEGGYQLESILSADAEGAAFKVRVLGDASANAIAKMFGMEPANAEEQVELWESTRKLKNRDLLIPRGAGQIQIDGATVAYVIAEKPEEILDGVIRDRALSLEEAGDVLLSVIGGLDELHSHGFVHGSVSPDYIVAVRDAIKLSVECVGRRGFAPRLHLREPKYRAPESAGQYVTPEADVWCLGATLIEILSQQSCGDDYMDQALRLPAPFDGIARRCLDPDPETRPKVGQVEAMFRSSAAAWREPKTFEVPVRESAPASQTAAPPMPRRVAKPVAPYRTKRTVPSWMYAAAAGIVLFVLIWTLWPKQRASAPAPRIVARSAKPITQSSAWESKTITPDDAKTVTSTPASPAQAVAPPSAPSVNPTASGPQQLINGTVWRVVLYTYARSADADNKARWVNEKYPGLNAETFAPGGSLYLVVVGGQMNRQDAEHLRQRVRAMGLPRDSYIQNYKQ